jgi:2-succinyl-6-hydroxy-2,4-cyclohexadiene-1-carboxylate synthase
VLHAVTEGSGSRLVLVHGFTQTHACWGPVGDDLATDHEVVRVDAPGHGGSAGIDTDLIGGARLLGEVGGPATYLGYSMGARLALHLAIASPELVRGLVLVGGTAGIEDPAERATRRRADDDLAAQLEAEGVEAFVDRWLAQPLFAGLDEAAACRAERLTNSVAGLASSLRRAGTGTQEPLWDRLGAIGAPTLVVTGEHDRKFTELGRRLAGAVPDAALAVVPGAGHTAHLERPAAFLAALRPWLRDRGL